MNESPLVSVVIPAFNAERFLSEAIESVLAQTYAPVETIVVDDGSADRTVDVARSFDGVTLVEQENAGPSAARNRGFAACNGAVIAFHDADDVMPIDKLEIQVGRLLAEPETECVLGTQELIVEDGAALPFWAEGSTAPAVLPNRPAELRDEPQVHPMTMVVRRQAFERVGGFDESMRSGEDLDWMLRAAETGLGIARLHDVVLRRRVHAASITQDAELGRAGLALAFKKRLDRRRASA